MNDVTRPKTIESLVQATAGGDPWRGTAPSTSIGVWEAPAAQSVRATRRGAAALPCEQPTPYACRSGVSVGRRRATERGYRRQRDASPACTPAFSGQAAAIFQR
jgi:hypothetical protein